MASNTTKEVFSLGLADTGNNTRAPDKDLKISDSELKRFVKASESGLEGSALLASFTDELGLVVDDAASLQVFSEYAADRFNDQRAQLEKKFGRKAVQDAEAALKTELSKMKEDAAIPLDFTAPRLQGPGAMTATGQAQSEVFK